MTARSPMARSEANAIAGSMIDAALLLLELPATDHVNVGRLIDHAELLLDQGGDWMSRLDAISVWTSILEDAVIPLEQTSFLGVAEELLGHYDRLTDLIQNT